MPPQSGGERVADVPAGFPGGGVAGPLSTAPESRAHRRVPVEVVLGAHLGPARRRAIESYVEHRAKRGDRVGVVWTGPEGTHLRHVMTAERGRAVGPYAEWAVIPESREEGDVGPFPAALAPRQNWAAAILEGEILCDRLVIAGTPREGSDDASLLAAAPGAVVLCEGNEPGQLAAYKTLKRYASALADRVVALFVVGAADVQDGAATGRRMAQLAERFLGLTVRYAGCTVHETPLRQVLAAQDILPETTGEGPHWLEAVKQVIDRVGVPPPEDADPTDARSGTGSSAVASPSGVQIDFALPIDAPLRRPEQLEEFITEYLSAFCADAVLAERVGEAVESDAIVLRVRRRSGASAILVGTVHSAPGTLEGVLSLLEEPDEGACVVWIGAAPSEAQRRLAERLGMRLRHVGLRYVSVEGRLGVLIDRAGPLSSGEDGTGRDGIAG